MLVPRKGRVILKPIETERLASGIYIPDDAKNPNSTQRAEIKWLNPIDSGEVVSEGEEVFFKTHYCRTVEVGGEEYLETAIDELLGVIQ